MNLIVSDFDGTFYDENYLENIKFIENLDDTYDFVIATGRNYKSLKKDLKTKCKYYICNDGGYILDKDENVIYKNYIDNEEIKKIYNKMKELNYNEYFFDYIDKFDKNFNDNINKLSIKIQNDKATKDMEYMLKDINNVYGYISTNWINILGNKSKKENAIDKLLELHKYDNVYVIGNEINDYNMIKKYNGYLISNKKNTSLNTIKNFLELKKKL